MRLPEVVPLSGVSMDNVTVALRKVSTELANVNKNGVEDTLHAYQQWYAHAGETLAFLFSPNNIEMLLTSRRHWWLMDATATYREAERWQAIGASVRAEAVDRKKAVDDLIQAYETIGRAWSDNPLTAVVMPDTNFYLHHPKPFFEVDWKALTGVVSYKVRLLVPIAIVQELDEKKTTAKGILVGQPPEQLRTRARRTSRRLRELLDDPLVVANLTPSVEVELVLDPLSHHPRPETDLEIIERTLATKTLVARDVKIATFDGGMAFAAKTEGLSILSLPDPE